MTVKQQKGYAVKNILWNLWKKIEHRQFPGLDNHGGFEAGGIPICKAENQTLDSQLIEENGILGLGGSWGAACNMADGVCTSRLALPSKGAADPIADQPVPEILSLAGLDSADNSVDQSAYGHEAKQAGERQ